MLNHFPVEILLLIIENIDEKLSLKQLLCVCKSLFHLVQPHLYRSIQIPLQLNSYNDKIDFLATKSTQLLHRSLSENSKLRTYPRTFEVCFITRSNERYKFDLQNDQDLRTAWSNLDVSPNWTIVVDLVSWLCNSLRMFRINSDLIGRIPQQSERTLCKFISRMPNLQSLDIHIAFQVSPSAIISLLHADARLMSLKLWQQSPSAWESSPSLPPTHSTIENQNMLNMLRHLDMNSLDSFDLWLSSLSSLKNLRTLELSGDGAVIDSVLRGPFSLEKALSPLTHLHRLTLNLLSTRDILSLNDLQISKVHSLLELNVVGWIFQPTDSALAIYDSLFAGGRLHHFSWNYYETMSLHVTLTAKMLSSLGEALKMATQLNSVNILLDIFDHITARGANVNEMMKQLRDEFVERGVGFEFEVNMIHFHLD